MRNCAKDFIFDPRARLFCDELSAYAEWLAFTTDDKKALHKALLAGGAKLGQVEHWSPSGPKTARAYIGVTWDCDNAPDDLFVALGKPNTPFSTYRPRVA